VTADFFAFLEDSVQDRSALALSRWRAVGDRTFRAVQWRGSEFRSWTLELPNGKGDAMARPDSFRLVLPARKDTEWTSARATWSQSVLWVNRGFRRDGKVATEVLQYDIQSGRELVTFQPPPGGWPARVAEISKVVDTGERVAVVFRYWQQRIDGDRFAVGVWPARGGVCLSWSILGGGRNDTFDDIITYMEPATSADVAQIMLTSRRRRSAALFCRRGWPATLAGSVVQRSGRGAICRPNGKCYRI
jgi:hypothetical protein